MLGLLARVAMRSRSEDVQDDVVDDGDDGVFWITRNDCRTCHAPIENPESQPTAVDESSLIAKAAGAEHPRSTFCSVECRDEFVDVFHDDGGQG